MSASRLLPDRRVSNLLMPLYSRVMKETVRLTELLQTIESASRSAEDDTDDTQFASLYLRKVVAELESPAVWFAEAAQSGLGRRSYELAGKHKQSRRMLTAAGETLGTVFDRISVNDFDVVYGSDGKSRLYNSIQYYRLGLQMIARSLEPMRGSKPRENTTRQVRRICRLIQSQAERLVVLPSLAVDQFSEQAYIAANQDVRAAVADASIVCGLEHFVMQGVYEAKQGGRVSGGVDLDAVDVPDAPTSSGASQEALRDLLECVEKSGLFDAAWYQKQYGKRKNPLNDYCTKGYKEGRAPNAVFDQAWYFSQNDDLRESDTVALQHYITAGEAEGRQPCEYFDAVWYRNHYRVEGELALAHYLARGQKERLNPNPAFDVPFYLRKNPDVVRAEIDPVAHFYRYGWKEHRNPSAKFNTAEYVQNDLNGDTSINPLTHYLSRRELGGAAAEVSADTPKALTDAQLPALSTMAGNLRYFSNPGPMFEEPVATDCQLLEAKAKAVAFFLPQFYAFEENDRWWGDGFTEWRNVARGAPRFAGHYQPRIPRDLGFYDLTNVDTLKAQARLARNNGIEAFCFYYYWFNGKRLMDKPLDLFADADIDQEFCIMWANENWTRTWDGFDNEVLIKQDYLDEDEDEFIEDTLRYFRNERYLTVAGRPLFILYRPGLLPSAKKTLARWRRKWADALGVEPWILMVQGFGDVDPREFGLDGAVEFPPHKVCQDVPDINDELSILDPEYAGHARSYAEVISHSLEEPAPAFPLIKTVSPHWDNDARREGRGFTMHGSTPELYERWLQGAIHHATQNPFAEQPLVFVNAWNEWAEGAYLEPDVHYGHAYLNATRRAVYGQLSTRQRHKMLLVGHDAYRHGAQLLLLSMARVFREQFGMDVMIVLKQGGPLLKEYQKLGKTIVVDQFGEDNLIGLLQNEGHDVAICNTSVTGDLVPTLKEAGLRVVSLIHELPNLIREYDLGGNLQLIAEQADHVIFPADMVKRGFAEFAGDILATQHIRPQGTYKSIEFSESGRQEIRQELGIGSQDKMILNVGYADLRKGFDIFLQVARQMVSERSDVHFVWVGDMSPDMKRWVQSDLADSPLERRIHLIKFTDRVADYYAASDCLLLSSREDPYPTVVLEAMNIGVPVVLFERATGFDQMMADYGYLADRNDLAQINRALVQSLYNDSKAAKERRQAYIESDCQFDDYCFDLMKLLRPETQKVSVVVPNYNYAQYMESRLASVFDQTYPVFETIVLDDCSTDNSTEVIQSVAEAAGRRVIFRPNSSNSGNVFKQWKKGLSQCRGDLVWIAEADDLAENLFLAESVAAFDADTVLSFTDSVQIGTDSDVLARSYNYYYRGVDPELFESDFRMDGAEFVARAMSVKNVIMNVSSALWDRAALSDALLAVGDELLDYKLVGDWRLYLEVLARKNSKIAYLAESLNTHRRHQESVTHSLDHERHLSEIQTMHAHVLDVFGQRAADGTFLEGSMDDYVEELMKQFNLKRRPGKRAA